MHNMTKPLAALLLALTACAHAPLAPARVFENTIDYDLPQGPGYSRELRYKLRWEPGTTVRVAMRATARATVRCVDCKGRKTYESALPGETVALEIVASAQGNTISVSSEETQHKPTTVLEFLPGPAEVLTEPRSTQALAAKRAAEQKEKDERAAANQKAAADRQAERDAAEADKQAGAARCSRKESVSHVAGANGTVVVTFCDASRASRTNGGEWHISMALTGGGYDELVSNEKTPWRSASTTAACSRRRRGVSARRRREARSKTACARGPRRTASRPTGTGTSRCRPARSRARRCPAPRRAARSDQPSCLKPSTLHCLSGAMSSWCVRSNISGVTDARR